MRSSFVFARRAVALTTLAALAACSGGGGGRSVTPATPSGSGSGNTPSSSQSIRTLQPSSVFTKTATLIGPATDIGTVVLHVIPNQQNSAGLLAYAQAVSQPGSPSYRQFLTASQIGSKYGASAADYAAVANYFASYGLKVGGWPQRLALTVVGPRASVEKAIGTTFSFYRTKEGHTVLSPTGTVTFAKAIPVHEIANAVVDTKELWTDKVIGAGPVQAALSGNTPQIEAAAFDYDSAYAAGYTGKGITIGITGTGGVQNADFVTYKAQYNWSGAATLNVMPVNENSAANTGGSPTASPPPLTGPCNGSSNPNYFGAGSESPSATCNPEDYEAQIDTEQASLARDATIDFYLAYVPQECETPGSTAPCAPDPTTGLGYAYQGLAEADDEIQQAIADNVVDILSESFGGPELVQGGYVYNELGGYDPSALGPSEYAALAVEGIAVFASSGDDGAETCAAYSLAAGGLTCVSYPASDANVTAVGGVTAPVNNAGNYVGPITGWGQQTWTGGAGGASGGGVSCITPLPPWQVQPSYETTSLLSSAGSTACQATGLTGGRLIPDMSLDGDPATGVAVVANVGLYGVTQNIYGGTSVAAPQTAAMWALVLQACAQTSSCAIAQGAKPYRLGNAAPYFWKIYQSQATYNSTIYDVTFGNNAEIPCVFQPPGNCSGNPTPAPGGYTAGAGWDAVTGLGVPFARHLITAVVGV